MDAYDADFGGSGPTFISGTNLIVGGGKEGVLYLISNVALPNKDSFHLLQQFRIFTGTLTDENKYDLHHIMGGVVYWDSESKGSLIYVSAENDSLKAYQLSKATSSINTAPVAVGPTNNGHPAMILSLSANGDRNGSGILWASSTATEDAFQGTRSGILRAFDAEDVSRELWNSRMCALRDELGFFAKFTPPTVTNGKVYMAAFPRPPRNTKIRLTQKTFPLVGVL